MLLYALLCFIAGMIIARFMVRTTVDEYLIKAWMVSSIIFYTTITMWHACDFVYKDLLGFGG